MWPQNLVSATIILLQRIYEVLAIGTPNWQGLESSSGSSDVKDLPSWRYHVRTLSNTARRETPPLDFYDLLPILEHLPRLREIDLTQGRATFVWTPGIEICKTLPGVEIFRCTTFINIDVITEVCG